MDNINQEQTKWEKLTIANDFVFGKVMQNKRLCKKLLEIILKVKIRKIEYPELQKAVPYMVCVSARFKQIVQSQITLSCKQE